MNILGIDLSLSASGLAMLSDRWELPALVELPGSKPICRVVGRYYYRGALITTTAGDTLKRWEDILCPILAWAMEANTVLIEGYAFSRNMQYSRAATEMGGILRYHLRKIGHIPIEIAPTSLKKFVTGKGNADKSQVLASLHAEGLPIDDHNMADAYGLAKLGMALVGSGPPSELPEHQREVISAIKHPPAKTRKLSRTTVPA